MRSACLVLAALALPALGCGPEPLPTPAEHTAEAQRADTSPAPRRVACAAAGFPTRFDGIIEESQRRYLPASWVAFAPCGLRAQLAAESGLNERWCTDANPHGTSAACISQITKAAATDIERRTGILATRTNPQASIRAGAWYLAAQARYWREPRSDACRRVLAVASYHGGAGTLIQGQRTARQHGRVARCYDDGISEFLPRHGKENRKYVARVRELRRRME